MSSVEISSTATEPITFTWLQDGAAVTGGSPTLRVRRYSDGFTTTLDFDAELFVADASAVQSYLIMEPVNATYAPGLYWYTLSMLFASNAVAPDIYRIAFYADSTLATPLGTAEIRVGTVDTTNTIAADTDNIQTRLPAALGAGGRMDAIVGAMAADAITAGTIAAGAIGASEAPLLANLDAAVTSRASAANLTTAQTDITTLVGYGAPPSAVAIGVAVWATAHGTPSINTFGWLTWRHAQWGTEIADKAIVGQDLVLRSPDLATTYATVRLRDKDGNVIAPAVGEPARFDPT